VDPIPSGPRSASGSNGTTANTPAGYAAAGATRTMTTSAATEAVPAERHLPAVVVARGLLAAIGIG
jgi:hypothetical protein